MIAKQRHGIGAAGFTLVEVLVALAVTALAVALAMPATRSALAGSTLRAAALEVAAAARSARSAAMRDGAGRSLWLDPKASTYWVEGVHGPRALAARIRQPAREPGEPDQARPMRVAFSADGSSSGGRVTLVEGNHLATIDIDWLTGAVRAGW